MKEGNKILFKVEPKIFDENGEQIIDCKLFDKNGEQILKVFDERGELIFNQELVLATIIDDVDDEHTRFVVEYEIGEDDCHREVVSKDQILSVI